MAVSYAGGTQASEGSALMAREKVSMMVAGGPNVGIAGGYLQGGGHSGLLGWLGFAADQVLEMTAVTADGRVVEMHEGMNGDLFWAFRGGGGGMYTYVLFFFLDSPFGIILYEAVGGVLIIWLAQVPLAL